MSLLLRDGERRLLPVVSQLIPLVLRYPVFRVSYITELVQCHNRSEPGPARTMLILNVLELVVMRVLVTESSVRPSLRSNAVTLLMAGLKASVAYTSYILVP